MSSSKPRSVLQCISEYQSPGLKRKPEAVCGNPNESDSSQRYSERRAFHARHPTPVPVACDTSAEHSASSSKAALPAKVKATSFYGENKLLLVDQRIARLYASVQQRLLNLHDAPFEHFALQRQAFAWAEAHELAGDLRIFSYEHDSTGKRSFIVTTYKKFWQRYQEILPDHRHHYEIIQEGMPCHLYFDLEFKLDLNPGLDGQALVDHLLLLVAQQLKVNFGMTMDTSWLTELESVTEHKFSRHIVIRIPGKAFANNIHVGAFVSQVCEHARQAQSPEARLEIIKDDSGATSSFVDTGVYTRNRAFRLFLSSKAGKCSILTPTGRFPNGAHSQKETFLQSLICNVQPNAELLKCFDDSRLPVVSGTKCCTPRGSMGQSSGSHANIGPSPYPAVDHFIATVCSQGGVQGRVRSWVAWDDIGVMLYNIRDNRWCGNIGKPHKSNGVFIIADLQAGVWHQRCYDPECRNYRSELMPLPPDIVREYAQTRSSETALTVHGSGVFVAETENDDQCMLALLEQYESSAAK